MAWEELYMAPETDAMMSVEFCLFAWRDRTGDAAKQGHASTMI